MFFFGLLLGLNEIMYVKLLAQCLAHRKGSISSDNNKITVLSGFKDGLPDLPVPLCFLAK